MQAKDACQLLGGKAAIDYVATTVEVVIQRQSDVWKGLAIGVSAWFYTSLERLNRAPRAARHRGEIVCHEMIRDAFSWRCEACGLRCAVERNGGS